MLGCPGKILKCFALSLARHLKIKPCMQVFMCGQELGLLVKVRARLVLACDLLFMGQPFVAHLDALKLAQLCSSYCTNINTNYFIILNCIAEFMHCIFCYFSPKLRLDIGLELDRIESKWNQMCGCTTITRGRELKYSLFLPRKSPYDPHFELRLSYQYIPSLAHQYCHFHVKSSAPHSSSSSTMSLRPLRPPCSA